MPRTKRAHASTALACERSCVCPRDRAAASALRAVARPFSRFYVQSGDPLTRARLHTPALAMPAPRGDSRDANCATRASASIEPSRRRSSRSRRLSSCPHLISFPNIQRSPRQPLDFTSTRGPAPRLATRSAS
jgi:hypothetical protein